WRAPHLCAEAMPSYLYCQYDSGAMSMEPDGVTAFGCWPFNRDGSVPQGRFGLLSFFSRVARRFSWAPGRLGLKLSALRYSLTAPFRSPLAASAWPKLWCMAARFGSRRVASRQRDNHDQAILVFRKAVN